MRELIGNAVAGLVPCPEHGRGFEEECPAHASRGLLVRPAFRIGCDPLTVCTNTPGSNTCGACPAGYTGDGVLVSMQNGINPPLLQEKVGADRTVTLPSTLAIAGSASAADTIASTAVPVSV